MPPIDTVRRYAEAWAANDLSTVVELYHDDFVLHYFGSSPLAGDHAGKEVAMSALVEATQRSRRHLVEIEDVLGGVGRAAIVAWERLGPDQRLVRRLFVYAVRDDKLSECWLYDEDQAFVDQLWSTPTLGE